MTRYVLGFMFSKRCQMVVLIEKLRGPPHVIGRLNGIGGKIEPNETPLQAMIREFKEETGVRHEQWLHFGTLKGAQFECDLFAARDEFAPFDVKTVTDEKVEAYSLECVLVDDYHPRLVANLRWMFPMAVNALKSADTGLVHVITETYQ